MQTKSSRPMFAATPRDGLYRQLLKSHLTVAMVGAAMLLLSLMVILSLRAAAFRSTHIQSPTVRTAIVTQLGVQRSLAALRGWVALGDPQFRIERTAAWENEVEPALAELTQLSQGWTNELSLQRLRDATQEIRNLRKVQWWIEDIAQTPGNEPARALYDEHIDTIAAHITGAINTLIEIEKKHEGTEDRNQLLGLMADLRYRFTHSSTLLPTIVSTGRGKDIDAFRSSLDVASVRFQQILDSQLAAADQLDYIDSIRSKLFAYEKLADEVINLRCSSNTNVAVRLLREEAVPSARRIASLLDELSLNKMERMKAEARWVTWIGNAAFVASLLLVIGMLAIAYLISRRNASQLATPIANWWPARVSLPPAPSRQICQSSSRTSWENSQPHSTACELSWPVAWVNWPSRMLHSSCWKNGSALPLSQPRPAWLWRT